MTEHETAIADYIRKVIIGDEKVQVDPDTPLVSSGLIDSMALVDILGQLEDVTQMRIPAGKVRAKDMDTIHLMFATAARVGKARKR